MACLRDVLTCHMHFLIIALFNTAYFAFVFVLILFACWCLVLCVIGTVPLV